MSDPLRRPVPWSVQPYDANGGYDCMTGAFRIVDAHGCPVCTLDLDDYGQEPCSDDEPARTAAKIAADLIVEAVNKLIGGPGHSETCLCDTCVCACHGVRYERCPHE